MNGDSELSIPFGGTGRPDETRCVELLCAALKLEPGIHDLSLDMPARHLKLRYDPGRVSLTKVQTIARHLGVELGRRYDRCALRIHGLRCADCMRSLQDRLAEMPGLRLALVNPASETVSLEYETGQTDLRSIEETIVSATGLTILPAARTRAELSAAHRREAAERLRMMLLTVICLVTLAAGWGGEKFLGWPQLWSLPLYLVAYVSGGVYSAARVVREIRRGVFSVDLLMITAALGAAFIGDWPEGGVLLFLFSLSNVLERHVLGRTRRAIEALMDLTPAEAAVKRDGGEQRVSVEQLRIGDIVVVRPGERISADGVILVGRTTVDQSAMTGESIPIEKAEGDSVFAATLNQEGAIEVEVSRQAGDTTLSRIVRLVEEAQSEKAQSHRFTDWFGQRYTIAVLVLAALTFLVPWLFMSEAFGPAFYRAMTVLVVASPCAVVISIPASILSAIACAARNGVLFKGGVHLEEASKLRAVAFDKTGTLTLGRPQVVEFKASGIPAEEMLRLAASVESFSEHPLGKAIVEAAGARNLKLEPAAGMKALIGRGIEATVGGNILQIGKPGLFEGRAVPAELSGPADAAAHEGKTVIFVADPGRVFGLIVIADTLRPGAEAAIRELRRLGIESLVMLTGDNATVAKAIAGRLGLSFEAELLPEQKLRVIQELRREQGPTAMVGDGINDAPALATANLGISLGGTGTDVALETADVVLMSDDLRHLAFAIDLGRRAVRVIFQNLVFAFGVMGVLLAVTLFGSLPLPLAVVGHEGSTVLVILNGIRLLGRRAGFASK